MTIKCGNCGKDIVVPDDIAVGQHVRCPYCNEKMAFDRPSRVELPTAVRPILQHVQPSGRGMQSEHELAAKRAAVESIERRIDHNEKVRKRAARKRRASNLTFMFAGLLLVAGLAWYLMRRYDVQMPSPDVGAVTQVVEVVRQNLPEPVAAIVDPSRRELQERYESASAEFGRGELARWKDAPRELKPKNAPAGTVYHALVPQGGKYALFELVSGGEVLEMSKTQESASRTMEDFKKACGGKPYFIACAGRVFVCGGGDLKMMDELRKALLPR